MTSTVTITCMFNYQSRDTTTCYTAQRNGTHHASSGLAYYRWRFGRSGVKVKINRKLVPLLIDYKKKLDGVIGNSLFCEISFVSEVNVVLDYLFVFIGGLTTRQ